MINGSVGGEQGAIALAVVLGEGTIPIISVCPVVDTLSVAFAILGFAYVVVAALVVDTHEAVGRLLGLCGTVGVALTILVGVVDGATDEVVDGVVGGRAYAPLLALDEDAEDAGAFIPKAYPAVAVCGAVASPTEKLGATRESMVYASTFGIADRGALMGHDAGEHLAYVVGAVLVVLYCGLCAERSGTHGDEQCGNEVMVIHWGNG